MNLLSMLAQIFFDHQARLQADRLREAGLRAAERGRQMAIAGALFTVMGAFVFSGLLVAIIDLGLQIDRHDGLTFSGLMVSASLLILLGLISGFSGWLIGREPREVATAAPPPPPRPESELKGLLEELAVMFLKDFTQSQRESRAKAAAAKTDSAT